jgi:hypothetical protein
MIKVHLTLGPLLVVALWSIWNGSTLAQPAQPRISNVALEAGGQVHLTHEADTNAYYVLFSGRTVLGITEPVDVHLGQAAAGQLTDPIASGAQRFYRVARVPLDEPLDLDRDGLDDVYELRRSPALQALDPNDARGDADADGRRNLDKYRAASDPLQAELYMTTSPRHGETDVAGTRETIFRLNLPLATGTAAVTVIGPCISQRPVS